MTAVIAIALSQIPNAAVAQPVERGVADAEIAGSTPAGRSSCPSARRAVAFYIRGARHWRRLSFQPPLDVRDRGRSCRQAHRAAPVLRVEARRARLVYRLWLRTPKLAGERPIETSLANPVNRNLLRIASCETGHGGRPNWRHRNATYVGGLGFKLSTWELYRTRVRPRPPVEGARAAMHEQLAVGRALVREFSGYSSWPECHQRLGLPG